MKPLILFDFDGTIADSLDIFIAAANTVAKRNGYKKRVTKTLLRTTPVHKLARRLGVYFWRVPRLLKEIVQECETSLPQVSVHAHMSVLIKELSTIADLGVVSSNDEALVRTFLKQHKLLKYFPTVHGGSLFGKHRVIKHVAKSLKPSGVLYVGDEVRDIIAARRAGAHSLAVTWGLQDESVLLRARPTMLARTADEARELLTAWIESRV